jgi:hypothetical protein
MLVKMIMRVATSFDAFVMLYAFGMVIIVVVELSNPTCFDGKFMPTGIRIQPNPFYRCTPAVKIQDHQCGYFLRRLLPNQMLVNVLFQVQLGRQQGGLVVHTEQARIPFQVHYDLQGQTSPDFWLRDVIHAAPDHFD